MLAAMLGLVLRVFLFYTVMPRRTNMPNVSPIYVGSHGPIVTGLGAPGSNAREALHPKTSTFASTPGASLSRMTSINRNFRISLATTNAATPTAQLKVANGILKRSTFGGSPPSKTANQTCIAPLSPRTTTVSGVVKGLQSALPLAAAFSITSGCSS